MVLATQRVINGAFNHHIWLRKKLVCNDLNERGSLSYQASLPKATHLNLLKANLAHDIMLSLFEKRILPERK